MGKYFNNILTGRTKLIKQLFVIDISVKTMYIHLFGQFFIEHLMSSSNMCLYTCKTVGNTDTNK